jgi:hypothetical protein
LANWRSSGFKVWSCFTSRDTTLEITSWRHRLFVSKNLNMGFQAAIFFPGFQPHGNVKRIQGIEATAMDGCQGLDFGVCLQVLSTFL